MLVQHTTLSMRKLTITIPFVFCACFLYAQNKDIEQEIRKLEQAEVQAVVAKDTVTLKKLWDKNYIVNNPDNKIVLANANPLDRPVLKTQKISFTREVEYIAIRGDVVLSMGNETVLPGGDIPAPGQPVKRRYTNIWMKVEGDWKLIARHANVICPKN